MTCLCLASSPPHAATLTKHAPRNSRAAQPGLGRASAPGPQPIDGGAIGAPGAIREGGGARAPGPPWPPFLK